MRRKKHFNGVLWMFSTVINLRYSVFLKIKRVSKEAPPAWKLKLVHSRSSHPELFCKRDVPRNVAKFTEKHLCHRLFFNKVVDLRPATLFKKETLPQVFSCEFCEKCKNTFFNRTPLVAASIIPLETAWEDVLCRSFKLWCLRCHTTMLGMCSLQKWKTLEFLWRSEKVASKKVNLIKSYSMLNVFFSSANQSL